MKFKAFLKITWQSLPIIILFCISAFFSGVGTLIGTRFDPDALNQPEVWYRIINHQISIWSFLLGLIILILQKYLNDDPNYTALRKKNKDMMVNRVDGTIGTYLGEVNKRRLKVVWLARTTKKYNRHMRWFIFYKNYKAYQEGKTKNVFVRKRLELEEKLTDDWFEKNYKRLDKTVSYPKITETYLGCGVEQRSEAIQGKVKFKSVRIIFVYIPRLLFTLTITSIFMSFSPYFQEDIGLFQIFEFAFILITIIVNSFFIVGEARNFGEKFWYQDELVIWNIINPYIDWRKHMKGETGGFNPFEDQNLLI